MADLSISREKILSILEYKESTGEFFHRLKRGKAIPGERAGTVNEWGHRRIHICGKLVMAHRLVWFLETGSWPSDHIDHINGDPDSSAFRNLRDVSLVLNAQNRRNRPGRNLLGTYWHKANKRWCSAITAKGLRLFLGTFDTQEQAHAAYIEAKRRLHEGNTL